MMGIFFSPQAFQGLDLPNFGKIVLIFHMTFLTIVQACYFCLVTVDGQ